MGNVISQPDVTFSLASADVDVSNTAQKVLLVGQITTAASVADGSWTQNIPNDGSENSLFGEDSQLAAMVRAFKEVAPAVQLDAIALDDNGSGVPRVVDFSITGGPATESGVLTITAGSESRHTYQVAVTSGDTSATVLSNAADAVNADPKCPFTASVATSDLVFTAVNDGSVANGLSVGVSGQVAGLTIGTIAEATAGSLDPTLTSVLDAVGTTRYQGIVWPWTDTAALETFLDARFNISKDVLDGVGFTTIHDTFANIETEIGTNSIRNSQSIVIFADELVTEAVAGSDQYIGPACNEAPYTKSALFAAIRALRLTAGATISRYLTSNASLEQFGGPALASLPYFNTQVPQLPTPGAGRGFTPIELESLKTLGAAVIGVNPAGTGAVVGEVSTTYLTDGAGNPDPTWKYLNYVDTSSQSREYMFNNTKARFAQSRLTTGDVIAGRDMANAVIIKGFLVKLFNDLGSPGYTLVETGEDARKAFKNSISITIDKAAGSATITMDLPIVTQLRTILATVKIDFETTQ